MNDELTPDERAAMRSRIVGGARDIKPAGAHRNAWIAGSIAAVLVVAIAGGAVATSTLSAPQIANSPSPTVTATTEPTPSGTPTPIPDLTPSSVPGAIAFEGDCTRMLTDTEASQIAGDPMTRPSRDRVWNATILGGISCQWRAVSATAVQGFDVSVLPWDAVPDAVRDRDGVMPECADETPCAYGQRYGAAWVTAEGIGRDNLVALVQMVGPRAANEVGSVQALPANSWAIPDCEQDVLPVLRKAIGRADLDLSATDSIPNGISWDVLEANGAAGWCRVGAAREDGSDFIALDIDLAPGAISDDSRIAALGARAVSIPGASRAWFIPGIEPSTVGKVRADALGGSLEVSGENLSAAQLETVAEALLVLLG
ncbi:MAG: hypothetical protein K0S37_2550 [Microbacterium sp.]|jgi:hypothetical protein|nr:hypothetical protein [Microbacterium sp.]